jgi:ribokinase
MKTPTRQGILVFGSLNMDLVARMSRMPAPGETLLGDSFFVNPGGKGANQAVACALQGAQVRMFGRVGDDVFSDQLRSALDSHAIDHGCVKATPGQSTGIAMIMVDGSAQNSIIVIPGANALVSVDDAEMLQAHVRGAAMLLLQLEVPLPSVVRAAALARAAGCKVLLNPGRQRIRGEHACGRAVGDPRQCTRDGGPLALSRAGRRPADPRRARSRVVLGDRSKALRGKTRHGG